MADDIRKFLQHLPEPTDFKACDVAIHDALSADDREFIRKANHGQWSMGTDLPAYSTDVNLMLAFLAHKDYDWILASVNGHMGGTPWGCVGVPEARASFSATPLLSLWLSYFRLELGDERGSD